MSRFVETARGMAAIDKLLSARLREPVKNVKHRVVNQQK